MKIHEFKKMMEQSKLKNTVCHDPEHNAPTMMVVKTQYIHTCPSCNRQQIINGNQTYA